MATRMFLNLPVKDLKRSVEFFTRLGYEFDPRFTDDNAACLILGEGSYAMLIVEKFFRTFTPKPVVNAAEATEVLVALSAESREAVDRIVDQALAAGARPSRKPEDLGFMYGRSFQDPDGHIWEYFWMDPAHLQRAAAGGFKVAARGEREIVIERTFAAPRRQVFEAFTRPELIRRWLAGPPGWSMPVCEFDLRAGGSYRYLWRNDTDGSEMGSRRTFREVVPPERYVGTERFDRPWYPGEALGTFEFAERDGKTTLTVTMLYESREARDGVLASSMQQGLAASYERLDALLAA